MVSVLVLLIKGESALVTVARAEAGLPPARRHARGRRAARRRSAAAARRALGFVPFYRAFVAVEATLLAFAAAIVDAVAGDLAGSRVLVVALVAVTAVTAVGHLLAILASDRLR